MDNPPQIFQLGQIPSGNQDQRYTRKLKESKTKCAVHACIKLNGCDCHALCLHRRLDGPSRGVLEGETKGIMHKIKNLWNSLESIAGFCECLFLHLQVCVRPFFAAGFFGAMLTCCKEQTNRSLATASLPGNSITHGEHVLYWVNPMPCFFLRLQTKAWAIISQ